MQINKDETTQPEVITFEEKYVIELLPIYSRLLVDTRNVKFLMSLYDDKEYKGERLQFESLLKELFSLLTRNSDGAKLLWTMREKLNKGYRISNITNNRSYYTVEFSKHEEDK